MQIERIHERVAVRADFRGGVITPVAVARANGQRQIVESVSGRWVDRESIRKTTDISRSRSTPHYHFTVKMEGATYELAFDADVPEWWLERVMLE